MRASNQKHNNCTNMTTQKEKKMTAATQAHLDVNRRHDFVLLFDVTDGNPNGDPDAGNLPRIDPETMQGLVTDVSLKRKVRDWVDAARGQEARFKIYIQRETFLTETRRRVFGDRTDAQPAEAQRWMCEEFYDIRMFGAVMSMREKNAGQVRGPLQLTFARSIDPILPLDFAITRVALETIGERQENQDPDDLVAPTHGTFGRKATVPYGLYRGQGFFNPHFGQRTGVTEEDLALFWRALENMWDLDRSASRGMMAIQGLYIFSHESSLGNAPAHRLFQRISVQRNDGVAAPRSFSQYSVTVDEQDMPEGVTLTQLV